MEETVLQRARELAEGLLERLEIESSVDLVAEDEHLMIRLESEEAGRLIGPEAETLAAFETILNRMVSRGDRSTPRIRVDAGGYRERRMEELRKKARDLAERVRETGRDFYIDGLNSYDRRVVHQALVGDPSIRTYSEGGPGSREKRLIIARDETQGSTA
jgi:spoIIIJ-associated protein